jgi:hypothetical protein
MALYRVNLEKTYTTVSYIEADNLERAEQFGSIGTMETSTRTAKK